MNIKRLVISILYLVTAGAVLFLSHYDYIWAAFVAVLIPAIVMWKRAGSTQNALWETVPELLVGFSVAGVIGLNRQPSGQLIFPPETQIALSLCYAVFVLWRYHSPFGKTSVSAVSALSQFSATTAIFLMATYWQWSSFPVVVSTWVASYLVARWYFGSQGESAGTILSATWALVASQSAWVFYLWLVNYSLGNYFIVPQASIVILGLGYCFAGIYTAHIHKSLSRRRLIEYLVVGGVMLAVVIAGTRWNIRV